MLRRDKTFSKALFEHHERRLTEASRTEPPRPVPHSLLWLLPRLLLWLLSRASLRFLSHDSLWLLPHALLGSAIQVGLCSITPTSRRRRTESFLVGDHSSFRQLECREGFDEADIWGEEGEDVAQDIGDGGCILTVEVLSWRRKG